MCAKSHSQKQRTVSPSLHRCIGCHNTTAACLMLQPRPIGLSIDVFRRFPSLTPPQLNSFPSYKPKMYKKKYAQINENLHRIPKPPMFSDCTSGSSWYLAP